MNHIEFIGPPGAGKSAIHAKLKPNHTFFAGIDSDAINRLLSREKWYYRVIYSVTPNFLKKDIKDKLLEYRYRHFSFKDSVTEKSQLVKNMAILDKYVDREAWRSIYLYKKAIEEYQIASATKESQEIFLWDEGFAMAAVAAVWHCESNQFPIQEYYQSLPRPNILVYVDAPTERCLLRQEERGWNALRHDWVKNEEAEHMNHREACETVINEIQSDVILIKIENTEDLSHVVNETRAKLSEVIDI